MPRNFGDDSHVDDWSRSIHDMIEEMHNRTFFQFRDARAWQPATNVYEGEQAYFICVDLAGIEENQVSVECIEDRLVVITGARRKPRPDQHDGPLSVLVMEIDEGPFRRQIELPDLVDGGAVEAAYRKGYLWIHLPKKKA